MSNKKVRKYPAVVKESVNGAEIMMAVSATSITDAHDIAVAYCKKHNMMLSSVGMPHQ